MHYPTKADGPTDCPVKDLAQTVQHLIDAMNVADAQDVTQPVEPKTHQERVERTQAKHRISALSSLIDAKREHALTCQAQSPEGALHQIALVSVYIDDLWDLVPSEREDQGKRAYEVLRWGIYSVANLLERLSVTPRGELAVEYNLPARLSPFAAAAVGEPNRPMRAEQRLAQLNRWMEDNRATRSLAWAREDTSEGARKGEAQSIIDRCERDMVAIIEEAATIVAHSLRGFALKARLLTCIHGSEDTNFSVDEEALYRSLIGQLLDAADLGRIDDGGADAQEFLSRSNTILTAEAA